jgi:hypothetical protein
MAKHPMSRFREGIDDGVPIFSGQVSEMPDELIEELLSVHSGRTTFGELTENESSFVSRATVETQAVARAAAQQVEVSSVSEGDLVSPALSAAEAKRLRKAARNLSKLGDS